MILLTPIESGDIVLERGMFISTEMGKSLATGLSDGTVQLADNYFPVHIPYEGLMKMDYGKHDHLRIEERDWVEHGLPLHYRGENLNGKKLAVFPMHGLGDQLYLAVTLRNLAQLYPQLEVFVVRPSIASAEQWYPFIYFEKFYTVIGPVISVDEMAGYDYYVNAEHFAHIKEYKATYPPYFYMKRMFFHGEEYCLKLRPEIGIRHLEGYEASKALCDLLKKVRAGGKPVVFVNSVTTGRVRDIADHTLVQFIEQVSERYSLIVSTYNNPGLVQELRLINKPYVYSTENVVKNVSDLIFLLQNIDCVITSDSGITHLAEALGIQCGTVFNVVTPDERTGPYQHNEDMMIEFELPGVCKTPCYVHALADDKPCPGMDHINTLEGEKVFWAYPPCMEHLKGEHLLMLLDSMDIYVKS